MSRDLAIAVRMLRKRPGFTLVAVATLALGIGATAAVFSLIQGVLLTPPPYERPERIVLVTPVAADPEQTGRVPDWAAEHWLAWQEQSSTLQSIAAYGWTFNFLVSEDGSEALEGLLVTPDYFDVVGLEPVVGRRFEASDGRDGAPPVVVIGHDLWTHRFGADPNVVGQTLRLSRGTDPPTIVGVMPPAVRFLPSQSAAQEPNYDLDSMVDYWVPVAPTPESARVRRWSVAGRLEDGASLVDAQAELDVLLERQTRDDAELGGAAARVEGLAELVDRAGRRILLPLLGAAVLVLLIACGNTAALLLVRGLQRQREYGVRGAMGAGRADLIRQVTIEALLLAGLGGAFGIALAVAIVRLLESIGGHAIPRLDAVTVGWPVLAFGASTAMLAALLAALYPALRAGSLSVVRALQGAGVKGSAGLAERRLLASVTVFQAALTLALLIGAGLLIRTMGNLTRVDAGFDTSRVLTMSVTAVEGSWADFHQRALERVIQLPGIEHAAFAWGVPLTGNNWPGNVELEGQPPAADPAERLSIPLRSVTSGYFELLGQELVAGRDFGASDDRAAPPVAIVNQALAERYFPGSSALGKKVWPRGRARPAAERPPGTSDGSFEIVGVVADARTDDLTRGAQPEIYLSLWQAAAFSKHLVIRTEGEPISVAGSVQRALREVEPTAAVDNVRTLDAIRNGSLAAQTFAMQLLIGFGAVATALTLGGLYGVLSLSVAARRRELAIRTAVGAHQRTVLGLVLTEGMRLVALGLLLGLAIGAVLSRFLRAFLFEVEPNDPLTLGAAAAGFAVVALLACWSPARRASRIDPLEALREE
jgi:putative ABC transport system permease protein